MEMDAEMFSGSQPLFRMSLEGLVALRMPSSLSGRHLARGLGFGGPLTE